MSSLLVQMTVADFEAAVQRAVRAELSALAGKPLAEAAPAKAGGKKEKKPKKERDPDAPKKEAYDWIKFTQRVRALLETSEGKKLGVEVTQFCGELKAKLPKKDGTEKPDYSAIEDEAITAAYKSWEKPEHSKQELAGKNKRKNSGGSSVAGSEEEAESDSESKASGGEEKKKRQSSPEAKARAAEKRAAKKAAKAGSGGSVAEEEDKPKAEDKPKKAEEKPKTAAAPKAVAAEAPKAPPAKAAEESDSEDEEEDDIQAFNPLEGHEGLHVNCRGDVVDEEMNWVGKFNFAKKTINKKAPKPEDLDLN